MRKGDLKKQEILQTAEDLFCKKGYEETSVQDILDILHTSKGSFYHHFESKEYLLEAMCDRRAMLIAHQAEEEEQEVAARHHHNQAEEEERAFGKPIARLNSLLSGVFPLKDERLSFLMMILPVFSTRQGHSLRTRYCEALLSSFHEPVTRTLTECLADDSVNVYDPEITADICINTMNHLWCDLCDTIIRATAAGEDMPDLARIIHQYRIITERILSAPYGSMDLVSMQDLMLLSAQIRTHWKS